MNLALNRYSALYRYPGLTSSSSDTVQAMNLFVQSAVVVMMGAAVAAAGAAVVLLS